MDFVSYYLGKNFISLSASLSKDLSLLVSVTSVLATFLFLNISEVTGQNKAYSHL